MSMTLLHGSFEPLIYGVIIILGLMVLVAKFIMGWWQSFILDIAIFAAVFWMHGGTMTGGMAAAVAALLGGLILPPFIKGMSAIRRLRD